MALATREPRSIPSGTPPWVRWAAWGLLGPSTSINPPLKEEERLSGEAEMVIERLTVERRQRIDLADAGNGCSR